MRKTVVFAEDSKEALEIIARELGPTALILETRRVKDGVEVVAGINDLPSAAAQRENFNRVLNEVRSTNSLLSSSAQEPQRAKPAAASPTPMPPKPAVTAAAKEDRIEGIIKRLDDITALLMEPRQPIDRPPTNPQLKPLMDWGLNADLLHELGTADPLTHLYKRLCAPALGQRLAAADVVFVHGASGSGKSSTLARLAAQLKRSNPDRKLVLAATDQQKAGALEYMRQIGRLLEIPVLSLSTDYAGFDNLVGRGFTVCLDMPSDLQASLAASRRLVATLSGRYQVLPLVAIEAAMSEQACRLILAGAAEFSKEVILTKMDEVKPTGTLLAGILAQQAKIAACAEGARSLVRMSEFSASNLKDWFEQTQWTACAA